MSLRNAIAALACLNYMIAVIEGASPADTIACVTGVTGYFASELVSQLLDKGWTVRGTVRSLDPKRTSFLRRIAGAERLTLMEADLLKNGSFAECCRGARFLFHTASPFVTSGIKNPQA